MTEKEKGRDREKERERERKTDPSSPLFPGRHLAVNTRR